jgi:hypothetical protein
LERQVRGLQSVSARGFRLNRSRRVGAIYRTSSLDEGLARNKLPRSGNEGDTGARTYVSDRSWEEEKVRGPGARERKRELREGERETEGRGRDRARGGTVARCLVLFFF